MKRLVLAVVLSAVAVSAQAQTRYNAWSDPNVPHTAAQSAFVKELRTLVSEAEKARAADPKFLQDLKNLAAKYDVSLPSVIFSDDFSDGDFTKNPAWQVTSGKYWIEKGYGLRSIVEKVSASTSQNNTSNQQQKLSKEEMIIGVLGAVLGGQTQQQGKTQQQAAVTPKNDPATIQLTTPVKNAFTLKMSLSSWAEGAQFEMGPYQGNEADVGYKLVYRSGQTPALQLLRNYKSSSSVVASLSSLKLEDQKYHEIEWIRNPAGAMSVSIDGKSVLQATDNGFRDDFSGFVMKNISGDLIIKSVAMQTTP